MLSIENIIFAFVFLSIGTTFGYFLRASMQRSGDYQGTIVVTKTDEMTAYSLEFPDGQDLGDFQYRKEIVFRVEHSEEIPARE